MVIGSQCARTTTQKNISYVGKKRHTRGPGLKENDSRITYYLRIFFFVLSYGLIGLGLGDLELVRSYGLGGLVKLGRMLGGETRLGEKETFLVGWMTVRDLGLNILLGGTCGCFLTTDIFLFNCCT